MPEDAALLPGTEIWWDAFWSLCGDRDTGMGAGPLKWTAIDAYARRYGISGAPFEWLVRALREIDDEYLANMKQKQEDASRNKR